MKAWIQLVMVGGLWISGMPVEAATFEVTTTADTGAGSLRQAIVDANAAGGVDTITFRIASGEQTLMPASELPEVTDPVVIDGTTQPGYAGQPLIEINGQGAGNGSDGIRISAGGSTLRGLSVVRFGGDGVELTGGGGNTVEGCYLGIAPAGDRAFGNLQNGIYVHESADNTIGGLDVARRNCIGGNSQNGVFLDGEGASENAILGNFIGTDFTGTDRLGNGRDGVYVRNGSANEIGGTAAGARNLISGNSGSGIRLDGATASINSVEGNWIGVDAEGTAGLPNFGRGVYVSNAPDNVIGGAAEGAGNLIAKNNQEGIRLEGALSTGNVVTGNWVGTNPDESAALGNNTYGIAIASSAAGNQIGTPETPNVIAYNNNIGVNIQLNSTGNSIRGNRVFENGALGIDLGSDGVTANDAGDGDGGANLLQNFPVLRAATLTVTQTTVDGDLNSTPDTEFRIDVYANRHCDATGHGEGEEYLGSVAETTDGDGVLSFTAVLPAASIGRHITATATDPDGNTSEFSRCLAASSELPAQTFTVTQSGDDGPGSLRQAILDSNAALSDDTIAFDLEGEGPHTIAPASALPEITDPVTVDGTTQAGYSGDPLIDVDGSSAGFSSSGLRITAGYTTVRGLIIRNFRQHGIELTVGGNNVIQGNFIGTDATGVGFSGNGQSGIVVRSAANTIGGAEISDRNVISGNGNHGIAIDGGEATGNIVQGNFIGTDITGDRNLRNNRNGIEINNAASGNRIGGTAAGEGNRIAFNNGHGVIVLGFNSIENAIRGNSIFENNERGLLLGFNVSPNDEGDGDTGPNNFQNYPVITTAAARPGSTEISGTLNSHGETEYALDFFASQACDNSGNGEGRQFLGTETVTTDASGNASFTFEIPAQVIGRFITATATDPAGNTSEHSACHELDATTIPPATFTVINTETDGLGSLAQAIRDSNGTVASGPNLIHFDLPGEAPFIVALEERLPVVSVPVLIDATTQPGFAGTPVIELNGEAAQIFGASPGLELTGGGTTIRGFAITGFAREGIKIAGPGSNLIEGNYIGLDPTGTTAKPNNSYGIHILNSASNRIGGTTAATRNVISGNRSDGILVQDAVFGGDPVAVDNLIMGNYLGTDATGDLARGNQGNGISIISTSDTVVGGTEAGAGNRIAFNSANGVALQGGGRAIRNSIRGNSMFANGGSGANAPGILLGFNNQLPNDSLDADSGENGLQNYPVITAVTLNESSIEIRADFNSLPETEFQLEFFANVVCDPSGFGEGRQFLGSTTVTTDTNGDARVDGLVLSVRAGGRWITATATGPEGTSQYGECFRAESNLPAATFVVDNAGDSGPGSLRQAILDVNSSPIDGGARHTIEFNLAGGGAAQAAAVQPVEISLTSPLPPILEPVLLDGTTQPGYSGVPVVELNGADSGFGTSGIDLVAGNNIVRGLAIGQFSGAGIRIHEGGSNQIEANYVGIHSNGTDRMGNGRGILIEDSAENLVGGDAPGAGNLISGNNGDGVHITGEAATGNRIIGNWIGLDATGFQRVQNNSSGIAVVNARENMIGGPAEAESNVISGNQGNGVSFTGTMATGNRVLGNLIGTDVAGAGAVGNSGSGISVGGGDTAVEIDDNVISGNLRNGVEVFNNAMGVVLTGNAIGTDRSGSIAMGNTRDGVNISGGADNQIGGASENQGNRIAHNNGAGVRITNNTSTGNQILGNAIYANGSSFSSELGINLGFDSATPNDENDADTGPNQLQNFPALAAATITGEGTRIAGSLVSTPDTEFRIEFFASSLCDPSGYGEGEKFLGFTLQTTDAQGNVDFDVTVSGLADGTGRQITATATDPEGNTSEFSECIAAESTIPGATFTVVNADPDGPGSLARAIRESNRHIAGENNRIVFDIPSAAGGGDDAIVIHPEGGLPPIVEPATLDGYTQAGAAPNAAEFGSDAVLRIQIDGKNESGNPSQDTGVTLAGNKSILRGLNITGWGVGVLISGGTANIIEGCFIGTDAAGETADANQQAGIRLENNATGNRIGGADPAGRNLISGNRIYGIHMSGARENEVINNLIGSDASGNFSLSNVRNGVRIEAESTGNLIGSLAAPNRIAFNGAAGVAVNQNSTGNTIRGNSLTANAGLGIDLEGRTSVDPNDPGDPDTGGNNLQNYPVLDRAVINAADVLVEGSLNSRPDTAFTLDFYANSVCDLLGNGEGEQFLGGFEVVTDSNGDAVFSESLPVLSLYDFISGTATDPDGNTSEFSACFAAEINASSLRISNANVPEGDPASSTIASVRSQTNGDFSEAVFNVTLDRPAEGAVNFNFITQGGTATEGVDYEPISGSLTIPAGETFVQLIVPVRRDTEPEPDETFVVVISGVTGARTLDGRGLGTIEDDDGPDVLPARIAEESFDYPEGALGNRDGGLGWGGAWPNIFGINVVSPGLTYSDGVTSLDHLGNAVSSGRFNAMRPLAGEFGIPGSTVYISFLCRIDGETQSAGLQLGDEVANDQGGTTVEGRLLIGKTFGRDNWGVLGFGVSGSTASSAVPAGPLTFLVACLEFSEANTTVRLYVNPPLTGLPDTPDAVLTRSAFVFDHVTMTSSSGASVFMDEIRIGRNWNSVAPPFQPRLSIDDVAVTEGDSGTVEAVFTVSMSGPSTDSVTVNYATVDGTAEATGDYQGTSGVLEFSPGALSQEVRVPVHGELLEEADESFRVVLSDPRRATLQKAEGTGTILDDDTPPVVTVYDGAAFEGAEGDRNTVQFIASLSGAFKSSVAVDFATQFYTAEEGGDYLPAQGTLEFPPGTTQQSFEVTVLGDDTPEDFEKFFIDLSNPVNGTLAETRVTGVIANDDYSQELLVEEGDTIDGPECREFVDFLGAPVVNGSGVTVFLAQTAPCANGITSAAADIETGIFTIGVDGNVRRLASDRFHRPGEPPYNSDFSNLNLSDAGFLVAYVGIDKPDVPVDPAFDLCIADDVQPRFIAIDTDTGQYLYHDCARGIRLEGTGTLTQEDCLVTLHDEGPDPDQPDRLVEVEAQIDLAGGVDCTFAATATIQTTSHAMGIVITDSDVRDSTCECPEEPDPNGGATPSPIDGFVALDLDGNYLNGLFVGESIAKPTENQVQAAGAFRPAFLDPTPYFLIAQFLNFCPPLIVGHNLYAAARDRDGRERSLALRLLWSRESRGSIRRASESDPGLESPSSFALQDGYSGYDGGYCGWPALRLGPPGWPVAATLLGYYVFYSGAVDFVRNGESKPVFQEGSSLTIRNPFTGERIPRTIDFVFGDILSPTLRKTWSAGITRDDSGNQYNSLFYRYNGRYMDREIGGADIPPNLFSQNEFLNQLFALTTVPGLIGLTQQFVTDPDSQTSSILYSLYMYSFAGLIHSLATIDPNSVILTDCGVFFTRENTLMIGFPGAGFLPVLVPGAAVNGFQVDSLSAQRQNPWGNGRDGRPTYGISSAVAVRAEFSDGGSGLVRSIIKPAISLPDTDNDGLSDLDELVIFGTLSNNPDSDGDGWNDGDEVDAGTNPNNRFDSPRFKGLNYYLAGMADLYSYRSNDGFHDGGDGGYDGGGKLPRNLRLIGLGDEGSDGANFDFTPGGSDGVRIGFGVGYSLDVGKFVQFSHFYGDPAEPETDGIALEAENSTGIPQLYAGSIKKKKTMMNLQLFRDEEQVGTATIPSGDTVSLSSGATITRTWSSKDALNLSAGVRFSAPLEVSYGGESWNADALRYEVLKGSASSLFQTRVRAGGGDGNLLISDVAAKKFGLKWYGFGGTQIDFENGGFLVSNFREFGRSGVTGDLPAETTDFRLRGDLPLDDDSKYELRTSLQYSFGSRSLPFTPQGQESIVIASVDTVQEAIVSASITEAGGTFSLGADFSAIESDRVDVEVYEDGVLVGSANVAGGDGLATLVFEAGGEPRFRFLGLRSTDGTPCLFFHLNESVAISPAGHAAMTGDEIRLCAVDFSTAFLEATEVDLLGNNLGSIAIESVEINQFIELGPEMTIQLEPDAEVTIRWEGEAVLQRTENLQGQWINLPDSSPYSVDTTTASRAFYRLIKP